MTEVYRDIFGIPYEEYCRSYIDQHETDYPIRNCRPLQDPSFGFVLDCSEEKDIGSVGCYAFIEKNKEESTVNIPADISTHTWAWGTHPHMPMHVSTYKPYGHFL